MTSPIAGRRLGGFTLLEVLIAFAIAAITLAVVIEGSISALSATHVARETQDAIVRARSRLAAMEGGALVPGERSGDDGGGFRWHSRVAELSSATDSRTAASLPRGTASPLETLYAVSISVSWRSAGRERTVQLDSTRLATASPP